MVMRSFALLLGLAACRPTPAVSEVTVATAPSAVAEVAPPPPATASSAAAGITGKLGLDVTGEYHFVNGPVDDSLEVAPLPGGGVHVHLIALLHTGPTEAHNGELEGDVSVEGDKAVYTVNRCRITFRFSPGKVAVTQQDVDDCGFGAFVTAEGSYTRRAGAKRSKTP